MPPPKLSILLAMVITPDFTPIIGAASPFVAFFAAFADKLITANIAAVKIHLFIVVYFLG
ncbi:MAG TPA: hypothetical protein DCK81_03365 [Clostridiales bacterium UBA9856]|nr:hypothetical protein [Clostridiales bacterium UBA9856]